MSSEKKQSEVPASAGPNGLDDRLNDSIPWIVRNGIGIQLMETLSVGAILTAFAIKLGASNFVIGLLAAIPHLSQLAQISAMYVVDRVPSRRKVYTWSGIVARPMFLVIACTVFIPSPEIALTTIIIAFIVRYVAGAFLACSWNTWMRELVPDEVMGRVFGERQKKMIGIGILGSLAAAGFIDLWGRFIPLPDSYAFGIVYTLAFIGGMYAVFASGRISDVVQENPEHGPLLVRLREPLRNVNYRRLMAFLASWNFAINLAAPFFTVHMLKRMELNLIEVIALATLSQLAAYVTVTHWGEVADRFSNKAVLRVCAPLFILSIFAWTFTTMPDVHAFTYPLLILIHLATGFANAGVTLASGNIALKLAPKGNAASYLASGSIFNALAAGSATMVGGLTADLFASKQLSLILRWQSELQATEFNAMNFSYWDFFFMFASLIGLYALHRLSLVREEGEIDDRTVLDHLRQTTWQTLRNLSTVAGLRASTEYPMDTLMSGEDESSDKTGESVAPSEPSQHEREQRGGAEEGEESGHVGDRREDDR
jgi:MFS family permease